VAVAAGRASPEFLYEGDGEASSGEPATAPSIAEAGALGQLILVAEDDEMSRKVILRQIEILGYAAEIADNGVDALRLWRNGHYALLLTDLHMPDIDGYALAAGIPQEESLPGAAWKGRMPIIALTANALRGEAVRAQAAGMDEYLTKPLQLESLKAVIHRWVPCNRADTVPAALFTEPVAGEAAPLVDVKVLEGSIGDDPKMVRELLGGYRSSSGRLAMELRSAQAIEDIRQVGGIAHQLKSVARTVGALALGDLCAELENACRTGGEEGVSQGVRAVEAAVRAADEHIGRLLALP
jgi:CheY-like chemotaxis protein/HPt (histidine-containing phosphotransfer) domain-containing protein